MKILTRHFISVILNLLLWTGATTSSASSAISGPGKKWTALFDGSDLKQWTKADGSEIREGWTIRHKTLLLQPGRKGGDIITSKKYRDFELRLKFRLAEKANSGIKYRVTPLRNIRTGQVSMMGIEYQLIDDILHPEIKAHPHGAMSTGAAYLLYPPQGKKTRKAGRWNKVRIVARDGEIRHWLNNRKVVEFYTKEPAFAAKTAATKFKDYPGYGSAGYGHILLQDHGDQAEFRNIKIRELK